MKRADEAADVQSTILRARRVPCICPTEQDDTMPQSFSTARGITIEHVGCGQCWRTWIRINCK